MNISVKSVATERRPTTAIAPGGPSPETWLSQIKNKAIFRKLNVSVRLGRETPLKLHLAHSQLVERIEETSCLLPGNGQGDISW